MLSLTLITAVLPFLALSSGLKRRADAENCQCGYVLSAYNDTYFPKHAFADFSTLPDGQLQSATALQSVGFRVADGYGIGGRAPDGTQPWGLYANVYIEQGVLLLTVPGGQQKGGQVTGAEIDSIETFTRGVFTVNMKLDGTPGTCQSMFTYSASSEHHDEQDIENLGVSIFKASSNGTPPGVELTNWNPDEAGSRDNTIVPYPSDPTATYHNYTMAWLESGTQYFFDGQPLKSPLKYSSKNPSTLILNNWSNGDEGFTQGPPTDQVNMHVKSIDYYYETAAESGIPNGCSLSQACTV